MRIKTHFKSYNVTKPNQGTNHQPWDLLLFSCQVMSDSFATPWTIAHQAPLPMGFSRQEYWSGLPFPFPGIFLTQGLNQVSCIDRQILYCWVTSPYLPGSCHYLPTPLSQADFPHGCVSSLCIVRMKCSQA